jgi:isopentenyldiphosphate isomerase
MRFLRAGELVLWLVLAFLLFVLLSAIVQTMRGDDAPTWATVWDGVTCGHECAKEY